MGQYYKAVNIDTMESLCPQDFDNGVKLMEHSYMLNDFVHIVETLLAVGMPWYKNRIVWAGDYADAEPNKDSNLYNLAKTSKWKYSNVPVDLSKHGIENPSEEDINKMMGYRYLANIDKKLYVDKKTMIRMYGTHVLVPHSLPLLTVEGNGRGGGDYSGYNNHLVGTWARDLIIPTNIRPDFKFLNICFEERA